MAIAEFMEFYNKWRLHSTLDYLTPDKFYYQNLQLSKVKVATLSQEKVSI